MNDSAWEAESASGGQRHDSALQNSGSRNSSLVSLAAAVHEVAEPIRRARLAELDQLLQRIQVPEGWALAATGSYARREVTAYSDIDLVILQPDPQVPRAQKRGSLRLPFATRSSRQSAATPTFTTPTLVPPIPSVVMNAVASAQPPFFGKRASTSSVGGDRGRGSVAFLDDAQGTARPSGTGVAGGAGAGAGAGASTDAGSGAAAGLGAGTEVGAAVHADAAGRESLVQQMIYPLWDAGIKVDYAVRTPQECAEIVSQDFPAGFALLHLTHISGDSALTHAARRLARNEWRKVARNQFTDLNEVVVNRWAHAGSLVAMTRPDLKYGHGGLRDVDLNEALGLAHLADPQRLRLQRQFLSDIRVLLHNEARRVRDVLDPEFAAAIGTMLNLRNRYELSQAVAEVGRQVDRALMDALSMVRASLPRRRNFVVPVRRPVDRDVFEQSGYLVLPHELELDDPRLPLRIAAASVRTGIPIHPDTWQRLKQLPPLPVPWPVQTVHDFFAFLSSAEHTGRVFQELDREGFIVQMIPEWAHIRGLLPRERSHTLTVDQHCLATVLGVAGLGTAVARPDLLLFAALFHDIGKGYDREHCQVGEEIIDAHAARMGLKSADRHVLRTLVREHTLLARLAATKDPEAKATIDTLLDAVNYNALTLELLAALAIADARATGTGVLTAHLQRAIDTMVGLAQARLIAEPPEPATATLARDLTPGEVRLNKIPQRGWVVAWQGRTTGELAQLFVTIATKGWTILHAELVRDAAGIICCECVVRTLRVDNFDQEDFSRQLKANAGVSLPPLEPAPTATFWHSDSVEVRSLDRVGGMNALINAVGEWDWIRVDNRGATVICHVHLSGPVNTARVEKQIMNALAGR